MKFRIFGCLVALCLLICGCSKPQPVTTPAADTAVPARSLLVVPFDAAGAEAFLLLHFSAEGEVAVTAYPRDTVFPKNTDNASLYTLFADGGAVGFSAVETAFSENNIPVDRILSVNVFDADCGLCSLLASLPNNLLFTNPPDFVYTVLDENPTASGVALSSAKVRRLLTRSAAEFPSPSDYTAFRAVVTNAVIIALATAFANEPAALFSALVSVGRSTLVPADKARFLPLFSPSPRVRFIPYTP